MMHHSDAEVDATPAKRSVVRTILKGVLIAVGGLAVIYVALFAWIAIQMNRAAQPAGGVEQVVVTMDDGVWNATPMALESVGTVEFDFVNEGQETHRPIVVWAQAEPQEMRNGLEETGNAGIVDTVIVNYGDESRFSLELGRQGDGDVDVPDGAVLRPRTVGEEDFGWVTARGVQSGTTHSGEISVHDGYPSGSTLVALCLDPEHEGRGEHVVLAVTDER